MIYDYGMAKVQIKTSDSAGYAERLALRVGLISGSVAGLAALFVFWLYGPERIMILGSVSITRVGFYMAVALAFAAYLLCYRRVIQDRVAQGEQSKVKSFTLWRDSLSLSLAYSIVTGGALLLFARLMDQSFQGMTLDIFSAAAIVGVVVGLVGYIIVNAAYSSSSESTIKLFSLVLVGGVLISMVSNTNVDWWRENFSTLGMSVSSKQTLFNFTLIIAALVLLALTSQVFASFDAMIAKSEGLNKKLRANTVKGFFVFIAIAFGCVGLFHYVPNTIFATLHNLSAYSLVISFVALIALLRWLAPGFSREFIITSYIIAACLLGGYLLFTRVGYLSLTAFELMSFILCLGWIILFLKNVDILAKRAIIKS